MKINKTMIVNSAVLPLAILSIPLFDVLIANINYFHDAVFVLFFQISIIFSLFLFSLNINRFIESRLADYFNFFSIAISLAIIVFNNLNFTKFFSSSILGFFLDLFLILIIIYFTKKIIINKYSKYLLIYFTTTLALQFFEKYSLIEKNYYNYITWSSDIKNNNIKVDANLNKTGNVYHIILDGFQTEMFEYLIKRYPNYSFNNFTFYPNFKSEFMYTDQSFPALFWGTDNKSIWNHSLHVWSEEFWKNGWCKKISENNVRVSIYRFRDWQPDCAKHEVRMGFNKKFEKYLLRNDANFRDISIKSVSNYIVIDLVFKRILPYSWVYLLDKLNARVSGIKDIDMQQGNYGFSLTKFFKIYPTETFGPTDYSFHSYVNFKQMELDEESRLSEGEYVFTHLIIPHGPYLFSATGGLLDGDTSGVNGYYEQAKFSLNLVKSFIEKLKKLGRYDNSLIIIHADHGWGYSSHIFNELELNNNKTTDLRNKVPKSSEINLWTGELIDSYTKALLLIKWPQSVNQNTLMKTSKISVQLKNIAPTIFDFLQINNMYELNKSIQFIEKHPNQKNFIYNFYVMDYSKKPAYFKHYGQKINEKWIFLNDVNFFKR